MAKYNNLADSLVKFGPSEKHTKFEKNFLMVLTNLFSRVEIILEQR